MLLIVRCKYSFKSRRGCGSEAHTAGKFLGYFYNTNAFLCHNFENLREGHGPSGPLATPLSHSMYMGYAFVSIFTALRTTLG